MQHPNKSFETNIDLFVCFICNFDIDAAGKIGCAVLTASLIKAVSQILNLELAIEENRHVLCKRCKKDMEDYGNLERRMTRLHSQIHSNYEATLNIRECNKEKQPTIVDEDVSNDSHVISEAVLEDMEGIHVEMSDNEATDVLQVESDRDIDMGTKGDVMATSIIVMYGKEKGGRQQYYDTNIDNMVEFDDESMQNDKQVEVTEVHDNADEDGDNSLGDGVKLTEECTEPNNQDGDEYLCVEVDAPKSDADLETFDVESVTNQDTPITAELYEMPFTYRDRKYLCNVCAENGGTAAPIEYNSMSMEIHLKVQHSLRVYICELCGSDFKRRTELSDHADTYHLAHKGEYQCDQCERTFDLSSLKLFRIHKRSHLTADQKVFACDLCEKKFVSKNLLEEHQNMHSGMRPYKCPECPKDFASKYTLTAHLKIHSQRARPFKCGMCDKAFFSQPNLVQHKKIHNVVKEYVCEVCSKAFSTQHNLDVHKIVHSDFKPFMCRWPECGKAFARRNEIKDHERTHTGEKPFQCEFCNGRFSQRSNLLSHKRATHFNDKRHKCDQCEKAFKRRRLLDYHIKSSHTGERPHKCDICLATFVYPEHYKKHLKIHAGVKDYHCEICSRRFTTADNRNSHQFTHSAQKPYECLTCGASFMRKPLLFAHFAELNHIQNTMIVNKPNSVPGTSTISSRRVLRQGDRGEFIEIEEQDQYIIDEFDESEYVDETIEMVEEDDLIQHEKVIIQDADGKLRDSETGEEIFLAEES